MKNIASMIHISGRSANACCRHQQHSCLRLKGWILLLLIELVLQLFQQQQQHQQNPQVVHAQERPFVTIPRFQYHTSNFRTDVCSRQYAIDNGTLSLRNALTGLDLSVAITNYKVPTENLLFSLSSDGGINETDPGLFVVILDEIAKRAGFQWRNTYSAIDPIDSAIDGGNATWSDLLFWELHHFDVSADYWGRSPERMARLVTFPKGWFDGDVVLVQSVAPQNDDTVSLWTFLLPFDRNVWMAIVGLVIVTGIMFLTLERLNTEPDERELELKPLVSIFIASLTFTGHFEHRPYTNAARLLSFSWAFCALIIAAAYTANFANFLIRRQKSTNVIIGTLEDALQLNTPVCVQRGTIMDDLVTKRYPDMVVVRKDSEKELFVALRQPWHTDDAASGCGAAITIRGTFANYRVNKEVNWDCSLTTENKVIITLPTGFATSVDTGKLCTSLIGYVLNLHMTEMNRDGFITEAFQNYLRKITTVSCPSNFDTTPTVENNPYNLSVKDLSGIFVVHGCSMVAALIFAAYYRWKKKKTM